MKKKIKTFMGEIEYTKSIKGCDKMNSLFDNSIIKRVLTAGYVGKEHYEIVLHNGSSIYVTDKYEMDELKDVINKVKKICDDFHIEDKYYEILTEKLIELGW